MPKSAYKRCVFKQTAGLLILFCHPYYQAPHCMPFRDGASFKHITGGIGYSRYITQAAIRIGFSYYFTQLVAVPVNNTVIAFQHIKRCLVCIIPALPRERGIFKGTPSSPFIYTFLQTNFIFSLRNKTPGRRHHFKGSETVHASTLPPL